MSNIAILRSLLDDKSVSGGSWAIPLSNVQTDQPRQIARSTNLLTTSTTMTFDLGSPTLVSMVALIANNLSKTSTWRIRSSLASDMSAPVLDVTNPGRQPDIVWGSLPWGAFPWDGYSGKTPPGGVISFYRHPFSVIGRYLRIDITDTGNTAGYVDIGRVMAGDAFVPAYNMEFGSELSVVDETRKTRSIGGQTWADKKPPRRRLSCSFDALTETEAMGQIYDFLTEVGLGGNLLVSFNSDDNVAVLPRRTFYGQLTDLPPIVEADSSTHPYNWRFTIEEMI